MKNLLTFLSLIIITSNSFAQNQLIWSDTYDLENNGFSGTNPQLEIENDTVSVLDVINRDNHSVILNLEYNLNGDLLSEREIGAENIDTLSYNIADFKKDKNESFYIAKQFFVGFNKYSLSIGKFSENGDELWGRQLSSQADTSYQPRLISLFNDSLLLVPYVKSHGYQLFPEQQDFDLVSNQYLSLFDSDGNNLWNEKINIDGENLKIRNVLATEDSWILIEESQTPRIIELEVDGSYDVIHEYDYFIGLQNAQITDDGKIVFSSLLKYRFNLLDLMDGDIKSFEYPTNLPSNVYGDNIETIEQDFEGNIYLTGRHYGEGYGTETYTNCDVLTLKFDAAGDLIWENRYVHEINNCETGNVIKIKGDFVYVGGRSANDGTPSPYDYFVIKINANTGENVGIYRYDEGLNSDDNLTDLLVLDDGSILLTGTTEPANWTTQYLSDIVLSNKDLAEKTDPELNPNPILRNTTLTISNIDDLTNYYIYSSMGNEVKKGKSSTINISNLIPGVYFVKLDLKDSYLVKKLVVK